jgi:hypothetical protein
VRVPHPDKRLGRAKPALLPKEAHVPLPSFLLIGAMKAGTTTLFRDLVHNPAIFFPLDKEPGFLNSDAVLTSSGSAAYGAIYRRARQGQLLGDASTTYSKLPDVSGVPQRARCLLGPDVRIIYLVREPVARAISHHHHLLTLGLTKKTIDSAVHCDPRLLNYGRYWMQLEPWLEVFGPNQVNIVVFEEYIRRRRQTIAEVSAFLGIESASHLVDPNAIYNKGDEAHVVLGPWRLLTGSRLYDRIVRPRLSLQMRERLRTVLLPKSPPRPPPPSSDTIDHLIARLEPDALALTNFLKRQEPLWNFHRVRAHFAQ